MGFFTVILVFIILLAINALVALPFVLYNIITIRRTRRALAAKGLEQQPVSFAEAIKRFFLRTFDYKHRASLSEQWWVFFALWLAICIVETFTFQTRVTSAAAFFSDPATIVELAICLFAFLPNLSLLIRRAKDVNVYPLKIILATFVGLPLSLFLFYVAERAFGALFVILLVVASICGIWSLLINWKVALKASNPYKNRYGDVPNVKKIPQLKSKTKRS